MNQTQQNRPPCSSGEKVNRAIEDAVSRIEEETAKLITYINDEVVPEVRQQSSRGLREASRKLSEFADYLEKNQRG